MMPAPRTMWLVALILAGCMNRPPVAPPVNVKAAGWTCGPYALIVERLDDPYRESLVSRALSSRGHLIERFASLGGGTWTIVHRYPRGAACIVDTGTNWREREAGPVTSYAPVHGSASWIMKSPDTRPCCGPTDCESLPAGSVRFTSLGWRLSNGVVWPAERRNGLWVGRSKDEHFWVCWMDPKEKKLPRCLFTPRIDA